MLRHNCWRRRGFGNRTSTSSHNGLLLLLLLLLNFNRTLHRNTIIFLTTNDLASKQFCLCHLKLLLQSVQFRLIHFSSLHNFLLHVRDLTLKLSERTVKTHRNSRTVNIIGYSIVWFQQYRSRISRQFRCAFDRNRSTRSYAIFGYRCESTLWGKKICTWRNRWRFAYTHWTRWFWCLNFLVFCVLLLLLFLFSNRFTNDRNQILQTLCR